jgi:hypothetical protein
MLTYSITTLGDITENGVLRDKFPFTTKSGELVHDTASLTVAKNQQANFTTTIQLLQLRSNITWERPPQKIHDNIANYRFGRAYEGRQAIWSFVWQVEQEDLYLAYDDKVGRLIEDFDKVPVINFCKETATFPANTFITQHDHTLNTYFTFNGELIKIPT